VADGAERVGWVLGANAAGGGELVAGCFHLVFLQSTSALS